MRKFLILGLTLLSTAAVAEEESTADWHLLGWSADEIRYIDLGSRRDDQGERLVEQAAVRRAGQGFAYEYVTVAYRCKKATSAVIFRYPVKNDVDVGEGVAAADRQAPLPKTEAGRIALAAACEDNDAGTVHSPGDNIFTWGRTALQDPARLNADIEASKVQREAQLAAEANSALDNGSYDNMSYDAAGEAMDAAANAADAAGDAIDLYSSDINGM